MDNRQKLPPFVEKLSTLITRVGSLHGDFARRIAVMDTTGTYFGLLDKLLFTQYLCEFLRDPIPRMRLMGEVDEQYAGITWCSSLGAKNVYHYGKLIKISTGAKLTEATWYINFNGDILVPFDDFNPMQKKLYERFQCATSDMQEKIRIYHTGRKPDIERAFRHAARRHTELLDLSDEDFMLSAKKLLVASYTSMDPDKSNYDENLSHLVKMGIIDEEDKEIMLNGPIVYPNLGRRISNINFTEFTTNHRNAKNNQSLMNYHTCDIITHPTEEITVTSGDFNVYCSQGLNMDLCRIQKTNNPVDSNTSYSDLPGFEYDLIQDCFHIYVGHKHGSLIAHFYSPAKGEEKLFTHVSTVFNAAVALRPTSKTESEVYYFMSGEPPILLGNIPTPRYVYLLGFDCFICDNVDSKKCVYGIIQE